MLCSYYEDDTDSAALPQTMGQLFLAIFSLEPLLRVRPMAVACLN